MVIIVQGQVSIFCSQKTSTERRHRGVNFEFYSYEEKSCPIESFTSKTSVADENYYFNSILITLFYNFLLLVQIGGKFSFALSSISEFFQIFWMQDIQFQSSKLVENEISAKKIIIFVNGSKINAPFIVKIILEHLFRKF